MHNKDVKIMETTFGIGIFISQNRSERILHCIRLHRAEKEREELRRNKMGRATR